LAVRAGPGVGVTEVGLAALRPAGAGESDTWDFREGAGPIFQTT